MADQTVPFFVTTEWLASHIGAPSIAIVDASWYLPTQNRDAKAEFSAGHIPGAVHFYIDDIVDRSSPLPHMLPDEATFAAAAGNLGLSADKTIVVYDGMGLFSAPRVWWTLRIFGARDVRILEGGLPKWKAEGRALQTGPAQAVKATFDAHLDASAVADVARVKASLASGAAQIVDARPADRFEGRAPEPRPGLRSGHMPGALNVPFADLIAQGQLKAPAELRAAFEEHGVDLDKPVITSCGSGVSAAILSLSLETLGVRPAGLYDGSWAEWGGRNDLPVATGKD